MIFFFIELQKELKNKMLLLPFFGAWIVAFSIHTLYIHLKRIKTVKINKSHLTFGKDVFNLSEIKNVNYTGRQPFGEIYSKEDAMHILFNDGAQITIYDRYYSNNSYTKRFLESSHKQYAEKIELVPVSKTLPIFKDPYFKKYKGGVWGFITTLILVFLILTVYLFLKNKESGVAGFIISTIIAFVFILHCNYIIIEGGFLIIRSFVLPWNREKIALSNIMEISFETKYKRPNGLRVITSDYNKTPLYYAATFYGKHWLRLKQDLQEAGINVRDELHLG